MLKMFSEFSKCCYRADLSKCCRGYDFSILQMLQYCGSLKMLLECCRVLFRKSFSILQNLIIINWNDAEPTDVALLSMGWVSFIWFIMPAT